MANTPYSVGWDMKAKVDYSDINKANEAAGQLIEKFKILGKVQTSSGSSSTGSMQHEMHAAAQEANLLKDKTKAAADAQVYLNNKIKQTGQSGRNLDTTSKNLQIVGEHSKVAAGQAGLLTKSIEKVKSIGKGAFQAVSEHVQRFGETSEATRKRLDRLNETGKRFRNAGYSMLPVSAALGASFLKGAKDATELQHRYTIVKNLLITGGESTAHSIRAANKMMADGRSYSLKYGVTQKEIGAGYEELVRRGYTANQALAAQKTLIQGSIASGDSYNDVVHNSTAAIESFGLRSKNTATMTRNTKKAVNEMAYAADLTATDFKGMGNALQYVGAISHGANQSLSETSAAIGVLSNNGQEASVAGTGLRQVLSRLTNPPAKGKYVGAMKQLGLSADDFKDAKGNLLSLQDIFAKLNKTMSVKGMTSTQKTSIYGALFGQTGMTTAKILGANVGQMKSLNTQIEKASKQKGGGYVAGLSKKNMDSWQVQFKRFKASVDQLGMSFAKSVMPTLIPMVKQLNNMVTAFGKLPKPMKQAIAYGTTFVALAGPLMVGAGSVASAASTLGLGASKVGITGIAGKLGKSFLPSAVKDAGKAAPDFLKPVAGDIGADVGKSSMLLGGAKGLARRIPWLGTALSATSLIGMNKKNAGRKIGDFGGSVAGMTAGASAGAALGSVIPGVGTAIGGFVGGAVGGIAGSSLGKKVGAWFQKQIPGIKKSLGSSISSVGRWFGKEWNSIGKFVGGVGNGFSKHIIKPVAGAFKSVIKTAGKLKSSVGHAIAAPFEFAVGLAHRYLVKPLEKPVSSVLNWTSKKWRSFSKTAGKLWRAIGNSIGKSWRSGLKVVSSVWNSTSKWLGKEWSAFSGTVGKYWSRITSPIKRAWHSTVGYIRSLWNGATSWLGKEWRGLSKTAGNIFNAVGDAIKKPIKAAWDYISGIFSKIGDAVGSVTKKVGTVVGKIAKWAGGVTKEGKNVIGAHANGGLITSQHSALVGEAGPELAYTVNGRKARILGAAGPHIAKVKPGERILNARDTAQVMGGGLGHVLPGYANGTASLGNTAKASDKTVKSGLNKVAKDYDSTTKKSKKSLDKFSKDSKSSWTDVTKDTKSRSQKIQTNTVGDYDDLQKNSVKQLNQLENASASSWKSINSQTGKRTNVLRKSTVSDFNDMQQGAQKQMNQLESGVIAAAKGTAIGFGKEMGRMKGYAHTAMGGAIDQLNHGITGIDNVLGQFGGNKSVINPIKYAAGSNGALTSDQFAMVNDANSGPRQEMIVRDNNLYLPRGNNRVLPLRKGDQVLNGRQTQTVAQAYGINHFAKGSGVSKSTLRKLIRGNDKNPTKAFASDFTNKLNSAGSTLGNAVLKAGKSTTSKYGQPWNKEVWGQMHDAMTGGGSAAGGSWIHSPGSGFHDTSGFGYRGAVAGGMSMHDGNDFAGAKIVHAVHGGKVIYAGGAKSGWGGPNGIGENLITKGDDGWYVIYQEFNGKNNSGAPMYVHRGDTVKPGQRVAALGPSGTHVHIGVSRNYPYSNSGSTTHGWNDLLKMHGHSSGTPKSSSHKSALSKLVAKEIAPQLKWVGKHLQESMSAGGQLGNPTGAGVSRWRKYVVKALKANGFSAAGSEVAAWLQVIKRESGGNPKAVQPGRDPDGDGSGPAKGLVQTKQMTFDAYKMKGHGNLFNGYDDLLAGINYAKHRYGRGASMFNRVAAEGYAKGGHVPAGQLSVVGENGPEFFKPDKSGIVIPNGASKQLANSVNKLTPSTVKPLKAKSSRPKIEPHITINFNGDISDEKTMNKAADKMERKLTSFFEKLNDEFGLDDSVW